MHNDLLTYVDLEHSMFGVLLLVVRYYETPVFIVKDVVDQ